MAENKQKQLLKLPPHLGWKPRSMRLRSRGASQSVQERNAKRSLLGSRQDRHLYTSAHGYRNSPFEYARICKVVDSLKGNQRVKAV